MHFEVKTSKNCVLYTMYILRLRLCFKSPPGDFSFQQRNVIMILANEEVIYLG